MKKIIDSEWLGSISSWISYLTPLIYPDWFQVSCGPKLFQQQFIY